MTEKRCTAALRLRLGRRNVARVVVQSVMADEGTRALARHSENRTGENFTGFQESIRMFKYSA